MSHDAREAPRNRMAACRLALGGCPAARAGTDFADMGPGGLRLRADRPGPRGRVLAAGAARPGVRAQAGIPEETVSRPAGPPARDGAGQLAAGDGLASARAAPVRPGRWPGAAGVQLRP